MLRALEAVDIRAIALFPEHRASHTQRRIALELPQQKLDVVRIEGNVAIQIADDVVGKVLDALEPGVEAAHFRAKAALVVPGKADQLDPVVSIDEAPHDISRLIGRSVVDDDPPERAHGLARH